mmetsp:Transcript_25285/g.50614  ORF Transcript_25285/g.50614 Transcript_25285/m.50614 type:complete len:125 (-) Transcript_25285:98-472(-)
MRILLNAAIAAAIMPSVQADDRHVSYLDSTHLFPGADFNVDIDAATQSSDASNNRQSYDSKVYGKSSVFPAFIRKMQQATGRIVNSSEGYSFHEVQVQTHRVLCAILMQELREWHLSRTTLTNH